ncbi:MAG: FeS assembly SUF system protein [Flavobacteriales bacterium]|nr:FeS assembly SUF system protein [Flavobacteriales bacterium]|tara:strand:+ start:4982 stop:5299 length:318 start_codon:yes stop_codon:yes gene_type:complete
MSSSINKLAENIVAVLSEIYDPEIPVSIYELGLIYDVQISKEFDVKILMTFTTPNCPVAESLPIEVKNKIQEISKVNSVEIDITWDPPWDKSMMSEEAKLELGFM